MTPPVRIVLALLASASSSLGCNDLLAIPSQEDFAESRADGASEFGPSDAVVGDAGDSDAGGPDAFDSCAGNASDAGGSENFDSNAGNASDAAGEFANDTGDAGTPGIGDASLPTTTDTDGATIYNPIESSSLWSTFDVTQVGSLGSFAGAAFDGQFIYFAPSSVEGIVARYDVQQAFDDISSWAIFDTSTVILELGGFSGAVFDGQFLYLVPMKNDLGYDGYVARYDTTASFFSTDAWEYFDVSTVDSNAVGFSGGTFDGQYIYLAPNVSPDGADRNGTVVRYDTHSTFALGSSWQSFDTSNLTPPALGFTGTVFDGRYVYMVPNSKGTNLPDGVVARYDTHGGDFTAASWSSFDLTTIDPLLSGFACAGFDGHYLYLVPDFNQISPKGDLVRDGLVARYDTTASALDDPGAWTEFDTTSLEPQTQATGFQGAAFDGRYLYLVPIFNDTGLDGLVVRFDTLLSFTDPASWSWFDTGAQGFFGAVFDGQYMYFAPYTKGIAARFGATTAPSMPPLPAFHGSFF